MCNIMNLYILSIISNLLQNSKGDEKTCYKALELFNLDLYAPNCSPNDVNALHLAGYHGLTTVCKEIMARGFHKLLDKAGSYPPVSGRNLRPASMAAQNTHFTTAIELLQGMEAE